MNQIFQVFLGILVNTEYAGIITTGEKGLSEFEVIVFSAEEDVFDY